MREEVLMAGTGGQGVLLAGQVLGEAALASGLEVCSYPDYTPEVRGGRANCTVIVADGPVGSPLAGMVSALVLMDGLAVSEHGARLKPGGLMVVNSSLTSDDDLPTGVRVVKVPALDIANELASERVVNMVMLGAYAGASGLVPLSSLETALRAILPERHHKLIPMNLAAIEGGAKAAREQRG